MIIQSRKKINCALDISTRKDIQNITAAYYIAETNNVIHDLFK